MLPDSAVVEGLFLWFALGHHSLLSSHGEERQQTVWEEVSLVSFLTKALISS